MDNEDLIRIKNEIRRKRKQHVIDTPTKKTKKVKPIFPKSISRILITIVLTLITLIALKNNKELKTQFYKQVYDTNFSFASINQTYQKYFGSPIPFQDLLQNVLKENTTPVFNEKLVYKEANKYLDGVKLTVDKSYLIPIQTSGLVVFIGEKENYGNVVIIQQVNGIDLWYCNVGEVNVKLYDYVEQGTLLGESKDNYIYLVYKKEGNVLDYHDYI